MQRFIEVTAMDFAIHADHETVAQEVLFYVQLSPDFWYDMMMDMVHNLFVSFLHEILKQVILLPGAIIALY